MKATRKLIPALAMLIVAAVVMSTASYAWFTMSRQVTANSMNVTVTAPNNLLIKGLNDGTDTTTGDSTYTAVGTATAAAGVKVVPASTVSAINSELYSVKDGEALNADNGALFATTKLQAAVKATTTTNGGYVDFKYSLKTEGNSDVSVYVKSIAVTKAAGQDTLSIQPVRFAILSSDGSAAAGTGTALFTAAGTAAAPHQTAGQAVASLAAGTEAATLGAVTYGVANTKSNVVLVVPQNGKKDITIRVWYEGEDTDCIISKAANLNFNLSVVLADASYTG